MREKRGWTQGELAGKLGMTQNIISRLESPRTSKPTITTLLRLANAFDVGLLVRFVPFGFYGDVIEAMSPTHVEVPSYEEELGEEIAGPPQADVGQVLQAGGGAVAAWREDQGYSNVVRIDDAPFFRDNTPSAAGSQGMVGQRLASMRIPPTQEFYGNSECETGTRDMAG
jgi:transcriptional regulator with XRE-family HTH domain